VEPSTAAASTQCLAAAQAGTLGCERIASSSQGSVFGFAKCRLRSWVFSAAARPS
jgi:hypothetical protein